MCWHPVSKLREPHPSHEDGNSSFSCCHPLGQGSTWHLQAAPLLTMFPCQAELWIEWIISKIKESKLAVGFPNHDELIYLMHFQTVMLLVNSLFLNTGLSSWPPFGTIPACSDIPAASGFYFELRADLPASTMRLRMFGKPALSPHWPRGSFDFPPIWLLNSCRDRNFGGSAIDILTLHSSFDQFQIMQTVQGFVLVRPAVGDPCRAEFRSFQLQWCHREMEAP